MCAIFIIMCKGRLKYQDCSMDSDLPGRVSLHTFLFGGGGGFEWLHLCPVKKSLPCQN